MAKTIILKNEKTWYHSSKKTGYIPIKDNSKYGFREQSWQKGVIIHEIVDENTRKINRAADKTFADLSLTKSSSVVEWNKRKIIHDIKIKIEKTCEKLYEDAIEFSIIQQKKSMFEHVMGSYISIHDNWTEKQLVISTPRNSMFTSSIDFTELNYDLDEDFALIKKIEFTDNYLSTNGKKFAYAIFWLKCR